MWDLFWKITIDYQIRVTIWKGWTNSYGKGGWGCSSKYWENRCVPVYCDVPEKFTSKHQSPPVLTRHNESYNFLYLFEINCVSCTKMVYFRAFSVWYWCKFYWRRVYSTLSTPIFIGTYQSIVTLMIKINKLLMIILKVVSILLVFIIEHNQTLRQ